MVARFAVALWVLFLLSLTAPSVRTAVAVNVFSLDLMRLWTPETLAPLQDHSCAASGDVETLQRMQVWLARTSGYDPHTAVHRGVLACLDGNVEQAAEMWRRDEDRLPAALFAAIASFSQGHVLSSSFADEFGEYGYRHGLWSEKGKDVTAAMGWYSFSLAYKPSVGTASRLARLYVSQGKDDRVEETWQRVVDALPSNVSDHWQALARIAELKKDWAAAAEAYQQGAERAQPQGAYSLWLRSGDMWLRAKAYGQAEEAFQQTLALAPDKVDAYLRMGEVFRYQKRYDEAAAWYRRAQEVAPNHYAPAYDLGLVARAQQRYDEALTYFDQSLALRPDNAGVLYYKAVTLDALDRRGEASGVLAQAIAHHAKPPKSWLNLQEKWRRYPSYTVDPDRWWALGREVEREKDWAKAAELYHKGAELAWPPDDYRLLNREALMDRYLKEWKRAEAVYRDLVERYPERLDAYLGLGEVLRAQQKYDEAAGWFRQAQDVAPNSYAPPYYLGLVARAQQRYDEALAYFDQSLALRPDNAGVLYYKAVTLDALDRRAEATTALAQAIAHHVNPPESWLALLEKWRGGEK